MVIHALVLVVIAGAAACQGDRDAPSSAAGSQDPAVGQGEPRGGFGSAAVADAPEVMESEDAPPRPEEPEEPDPGKVIAELEAVSAWRAVIDRGTLLARRGQRGVVYGRIGPAILMPGPETTSDAGVPVDAGLVPSPYVWLVDDTEGHGALGIRIALGPRFAAQAKEGDRVALGGAWVLDEDHRWYWQVDALHPVPPPASPSGVAASIPMQPVPSHEVTSGPAPAGARRISLAKDNDIVYFQVVGAAPQREGDGWPVADELGNPVVALLSLPGERATYGGQDMRTSDERWTLKRGQTYWLQIGRLRRRGGDDKPLLINARTAPVKLR